MLRTTEVALHTSWLKMVGKIKHVRQKIHQEAVKLTAPSAPHQLPDSGLPPKRLAFGANLTRPAALEGNKIADTSEDAKRVCGFKQLLPAADLYIILVYKGSFSSLKLKGLILIFW